MLTKSNFPTLRPSQQEEEVIPGKTFKFSGNLPYSAWFCLGIMVKEGSVGDENVRDAWALR